MAGKNYRIFKYQVEIDDHINIEVPTGSKYISVISQNDKPTFYVAVDPEVNDTEIWGFEIRGTGHIIDEGTLRFAQFLTTIKTHGDQLIWHIWRVA